jgi:glycerol-3-phosphate acyltransferase PlsY
MVFLEDLLAVGTAYAIGCLTAGYYLVRWRTGQDIRVVGSGGVGAKNVGRILGLWGFAATFLLDFAKGVAALALARSSSLDPWVLPIVILAVVAGHTWPLQLGFRGGKGIATSLGALAVYDLSALLILGGLSALFYGLLRNYVVAGLLAFSLLPMGAWFFEPRLIRSLVYLALAGLLLFNHRQNLRQEESRLGGWRRLKRKSADVGKSDEAHTTPDI